MKIDCISAGMGIDIKSILAGALGGKLASDNAPQVIVVPQQNSSASGMNDASHIADAPVEE